MPVPGNCSRARSCAISLPSARLALWPSCSSARRPTQRARRASALAASAGSIALLPVTDADVDARGRRRSGVESEPDGDDGDTGLGASLALSMIKDSALAELARNITTGGGVVLTASGTPFTRGRARSAAGSAESESGGALEIRDADAAGTVILAEVDESSGNAAAEGSNVVADDGDALHFVGAGELVLATSARHDLVAEASGGAERGTAVTAATPIDVTSAEATAGFDATDTFTLAVLPDAADAHGAAPEGVDLHDVSADGFAGLALSTDLPALEFEVHVGGADRDRPQDAIRSGDDVDALVGVRAIAVSALLDPAVLAPAAASARASGHDVGELVRCLDDVTASGDATTGAVAAGAEVAIGDSRQVVMAYLGALAAPIAASAGLTQHVRRRDAGVRVGGDRRREAAPGTTGYASRAELGGHRDAFRSGGGWAEKFVNDLGLAPEDQNPNAKIKIKL